MIGIQVSNRGKKADSGDPRDLSFSSEYYTHSIGKTEFRQTTVDNETIQHFFGYTPILLSFAERSTQNQFGRGFSGSDGTKITIGTSAGGRERYYALHQGI